MPQAIREYCRATGQTVPAERRGGDSLRPSKASRCGTGWCSDGWKSWSADASRPIHIVGGGAQELAPLSDGRRRLNRRVIAGPVEATAIGNVMMQAVASGAIGTIAQAREIIRPQLRSARIPPPANGRIGMRRMRNSRRW